jgi:hypothetical protein
VKTSIFRRRQDYVQNLWLNGVNTVTTGGSDTATVDDFTLVSGFGSNTGRKFIDPVAGEFKKQLWTQKTGQTRRIGINSSGGIYYNRHKVGWHGDSYGDSINSQYPVPGYDSSVYNNALSDLYENIRGASANLALSLGEARETARTLQVGKSIYELLMTARRARRLFLTNPSLTMSQAWLSYKYGWSPLLSDLHSYLDWRYHLFNDGVPVQGRARRTERPNWTSTQTGPKRSLLIQGKRQFKCEVKCWVGISDTSLYNLNRITSLNPLSIAWELVPLSFVVDWVFDIGGYLQNMESALGAGVSFKRGYTTEIVYSDLNETLIIDDVQPSGFDKIYDTGYLTNSKQDVWKRRVKLNGLPFPRAPEFRPKLGWQRITSAAALLRTILLGKVKGRRV